MRTLIAVAMLWALGFAVPAVAADNDDLEHFENRVQQLNAQAAKPAQVDVALQRISTETGVPVEAVRKQHKQHPNIGIAGLMIANVLANETKKSPDEFLSKRESGKKWLAVAKAHNVSVDKLNERLDRLASAIKGK